MSQKPPISITKMWSTVLSQSDNLTILGHHYMASTYEDQPDSNVAKEVLVPAVHFDFIIMINGKTKNFWWSFLVEKAQIWDNWHSMEGQPEWIMLFYLMKNIGYQFSPVEPNDPFGWEVLDGWIDRIMKKDSRPEL